MRNAQLEEAAALPEEEKQKKEKKFSLKSEIISWLWTIGIALAIVFVVNTFIARVMTVEGESMTNTLQNRERIITTSLYGELKRGDIVVIRRENDVPLIKRVIAVAGDTIDIDYETGTVYLNGEALDEPFIRERMVSIDYRDGNTKLPLTVDEGHIFVMGDNRNGSLDSRCSAVGQIDVKDVFGKLSHRCAAADYAHLPTVLLQGKGTVKALDIKYRTTDAGRRNPKGKFIIRLQQHALCTAQSMPQCPIGCLPEIPTLSMLLMGTTAKQGDFHIGYQRSA